MAKKKRPIEQDQEVEQLKSTPIKSSVTKGAPSNEAPPPETKSNSSDSSYSTPSLSAFELKPTCMQTSSSRKATVRSPREKKPVDGTGRWSPEDETALLNAVIQYKVQTGSDPSSNWGAFLDYIKKYVSLQRKELTKSALSKKVTKFKKDYLSKMERKRNEGEDENQVFVFSNPIEQDLFYLCDKAWGSENQKISLKIGNLNPRKKANLGQPIEESPAKKSRRNGVGQEKEKEDSEKGGVKKSNPSPGVILALPSEESPAKKRKKSEGKKQKKLAMEEVEKDDDEESPAKKRKKSEVKKQKKLAMEEVEKDDDEKKTKKKKVKVTDANEDDDNDEEEEEEDDDQKKAEKVKVKEDVVVVEKEVADANEDDDGDDDDDDDDDDDEEEEEEEEEDGANEDDDELKAEKGKGKGKEVTDATEDEDDEEEEDKDDDDDDANEVNDEEEKRKKNENMKEAVVVVEEKVVSANEEDDDDDEEEEEEDNENDAKKVNDEEEKGKDTVVDMEKHDLWGKYPLVLDSMERKFASMEKAGFGNVSTLREACKGSIDKIEEGKLKNWESRWRKQERAELESYASKKTLEKEQMEEWLDILQR